MKTMNFEQMDNTNGGAAIDWVECGYGLASMVIAVGAVATGPIGGWAVASFAFGWLGGGLSAGIGCGRALAGLSN